MKQLILIVFLLANLPSNAQAPRFEIKFSEPLALFVYVESLSSQSPDNSFKKQFLASVYNREKYKSLLAQFDTLRINYTYDFNEYPYASKIPGMTVSLIKKNLISSANLKEFKKRAVGIVPNANLLQLSTILYEFQLVYRELVYQPVKVKFEKQLADIAEFIRVKNIAGFFDKGLHFYKSYWEESVPFEIAFYPLPNSQGFSAEAFYNDAICALQTETKDYTVLMGVTLHEIFHILYDEQPIQVKRYISGYFTASSSTCSAYAYLLLNEALATSLGNGYVFEALNGKPDVSDWYNWKYIDQMAKKMYPLVSEYVNQKKHIDENFVNAYIKLYDENFSGWLKEMNNLMCYRYVITDNTSDIDVISRIFPSAYLYQYEDQVSENSIDKMKVSPVTKIIIVSKDNETKLALIKKKFEELKAWKYKPKLDFLYTVFLKDKTQLIIINNIKNTTDQVLKGMVMLPQQELTK
jgi:hypothetical protein